MTFVKRGKWHSLIEGKKSYHYFVIQYSIIENEILPSIKELSEIFQVTENTVNKYLKELYKDDVLCFFFPVDVDIDKEFLDLKKFINVAKD